MCIMINNVYQDYFIFILLKFTAAANLENQGVRVDLSRHTPNQQQEEPLDKQLLQLSTLPLCRRPSYSSRILSDCRSPGKLWCFINSTTLISPLGRQELLGGLFPNEGYGTVPTWQLDLLILNNWLHYWSHLIGWPLTFLNGHTHAEQNQIITCKHVNLKSKTLSLSNRSTFTDSSACEQESNGALALRRILPFF